MKGSEIAQNGFFYDNINRIIIDGCRFDKIIFYYLLNGKQRAIIKENNDKLPAQRPRIVNRQKPFEVVSRILKI